METRSEPRSSLRASSLAERAAYYRELLAEHAASGVGLKKFAESKGVPYTGPRVYPGLPGPRPVAAQCLPSPPSPASGSRRRIPST